MIYIKVVLMKLHVYHLLTLLIHFILFEALIDLIDLLLDLRSIFIREQSFNLRFRCIENLTSLH